MPTPRLVKTFVDNSDCSCSLCAYNRALNPQGAQFILRGDTPKERWADFFKFHPREKGRKV